MPSIDNGAATFKAAPVAVSATVNASAANGSQLSDKAKAIILKLQAWVYARHIKPHPFFLDFDRLRSYKIPATQFVRGLTLMMHGAGHNQQVTAPEVDLLCKEFGVGDSKVNWKGFADALDGVFAPVTVGMDPRAEVTNIKSVLKANRKTTLQQMKVESLAAQDMISNIVSKPPPTNVITSILASSAAGQPSALNFDILKVATAAEAPKRSAAPTAEPPAASAAAASESVDDNAPALGTLSPHDEQLLSDALAIIRNKVRTKRILVKVHLRDFDRQNKGHISRTQFLRCLKVMELSFPDNIMQLLLWKYASTNHPLDVHWKSFAAEVDPDPVGASAGEGSFAADAAADALREAREGKTPAPRKELVEIASDPIRQGDEATELRALMERIQSKYLRRRTDILAVFQQFDTLRSGRITRNRFRSSLNAAGLINLNDSEFELLCRAYSSANKALAQHHAAGNTKPQFAPQFGQFAPATVSAAADPDKIEYVAFVHALEQVFTAPKLHLQPQAVPKSFVPVSEGYEDVSARGQGLRVGNGGGASNDEANGEMSIERLKALTDPVITLMRDTIYTRRIHPKQFFTQHDRHHTGCVTVGKFEAIVKGSLGFQIGASDWLNLVNRFRRDATHIRYVELCERLNEEPPTSTANRDAAGFVDDIEREKIKLASMIKRDDTSPRSRAPVVAHSLKVKSSTFVGGTAGAGSNLASSTQIDSDADVSVATILAQLRTMLGQRRMDISDLFNDFDRLRTGRLPIATFRRAMDGANLSLSEQETQCLLQSFPSSYAKGWIEYTSFLAALDLPTHLTGIVLNKDSGSGGSAAAFAAADQQSSLSALMSPKGIKGGKGSSAPSYNDEKVPESVSRAAAAVGYRPSPRSSAAAERALTEQKTSLGLTFGGNSQAVQLATANKAAIAHAMLSDAEKQKLNDLLYLLGVQIHTRGTLLKPHFQDYDRQRCGRVNAGRFKAVLSLHPMNLTPGDFDLLIKRFELGGPGVSYTAFLQEIERVESNFAVARVQSPRTRARMSIPQFGAPPTPSQYGSANAGAATEAVGGGAGSGGAAAKSSAPPAPTSGVYNKSDVLVMDGSDSGRGRDTKTIEKEQVLMPSITTRTSGTFDGSPVVISDLIHRLQTNMIQKRMVLREPFQDFDPLRKGAVTAQQFRRVLTLRGVALTESELDALCAHYSSTAASSQKPGAGGGGVPTGVSYVRFCNDLDLAYTDPALITQPSKSLSAFQPHAIESVAGDLHRHSVRVATEQERTDAQYLIAKIAQFVSSKRLYIKPSFLQHDRHHRGSVMRNRFGGVLKDAGISLTESELDTIEKAHRKEGDRIDYIAFCQELYKGQNIDH